MMRVRLVALFVCFFGASLAPRVMAQTCPTCDSPSTFTPISPGRGSSVDGRRIVNVCFDQTAQADNLFHSTPGITNTALWNGLNGYSDGQGNYHPGAIFVWNN